MEEQPKKKTWMIVPLLLAAVGGPYALVNGEVGELIEKIGSSGGNAQEAFPLAGAEAGHINSASYAGSHGPLASSLPSHADVGGPRLEGPVVQDLAQVIRFDITPGWVAQHWARVSTCTSELELEGLRVPLVSGPTASDIAGSLTYYFDKRHTVQRVTFHGSTGDERRLVALLSSVYGFQEQPALGGGMYVTTWNGKPTSVLRVSYAPVVRSSAPHSQKQIALEINRPGEFTRLSDEMQQLLQADAAVRRW